MKPKRHKLKVNVMSHRRRTPEDTHKTKPCLSSGYVSGIFPILNIPIMSGMVDTWVHYFHYAAFFGSGFAFPTQQEEECEADY